MGPQHLILARITLVKGPPPKAFPRPWPCGSLHAHGSPAEPRWGYHVSLEVLPWLRDRVVEGLVIKHINFRNVALVKSVTIHNDEKEGSHEVELQLTISLRANM